MTKDNDFFLKKYLQDVFIYLAEQPQQNISFGFYYACRRLYTGLARQGSSVW